MTFKEFDNDFRGGASYIAGILGSRGSGKTNVMRHFLRSWDKRVAVVDPEFQLRYKDLDGRAVYVDDVTKLDWRDLPAGSLVLLDELDRWILYDRARRQWCLDLLNCCRPWGLSVCWTARAAADVPRACTKCSDFLLIFKSHEPADLEYLARYAPPELIAALPKFQAFIKKY